MANKKNDTLYTGVTSNLAQRIYQHKESLHKGFTADYGCKKLVFYELHDTMYSVISREKQIKAGPRKKKIELIESMNLEWKGFYNEVVF